MNETKEKVSKSAMVRDYLTTHPDASAHDTIEALKDEAEIEPGLFYNVKAQMAKKKSSKNGNPGQCEIAQVIASVKEFAAHFGGMEQLKAIVDQLV